MQKMNIETLRELLDYDPETGALTWRERANDIKGWNKRWAGKPALNCINAQGYRCGNLCCNLVAAHRVIVAMRDGEWPEYVDHINGDRLDNRLINLRAVTATENARNSAMPRTNTSGVIGVYWNKDRQKWMACIKLNGRSKHLGLFSLKEDAIAARAAAEAKHGFHENHGRAAA